MILADISAWVEYDRAPGSAVDRRLTALIETGGPLAVTEPVMMTVLAERAVTSGSTTCVASCCVVSCSTLTPSRTSMLRFCSLVTQTPKQLPES